MLFYKKYPAHLLPNVIKIRKFEKKIHPFIKKERKYPLN
jgi:hypothetical protein